MKKLLLVLLTVALASTMCLNVFAAYSNSENGDVVIGVTSDNGTPEDPSDDFVITDSDVETVYSVNLSWEELSFNIVVSDDGDVTWNDSTRMYDIEDGQWDKTTAEITVVNNSNTALSVDANFADSTKTAMVYGVNATISNSDTTLASAVGTAGGDAPSVVYTVEITSDVPDSVPVLNFTVGTITVSYNAN